MLSQILLIHSMKQKLNYARNSKQFKGLKGVINRHSQRVRTTLSRFPVDKIGLKRASDDDLGQNREQNDKDDWYLLFTNQKSSLYLFTTTLATLLLKFSTLFSILLRLTLYEIAVTNDTAADTCETT